MFTEMTLIAAPRLLLVVHGGSPQVPEGARRDPGVLDQWGAGGVHKRWLLRINGFEIPY